MKGFKTRLKIWTILAILVTAYLTFFGNEPSWSQNALKSANSLLNFALVSIAAAMSELVVWGFHAEAIVYKWFSRPVRLFHLARFTQYSFYAILIFNLDSVTFPDIFHLLATGSGVLGLYLIIAGWYDTFSGNWWKYMIALNIGVILLLMAFFFDIGKVAYGEFAILAVGAYWIYENKF